MNEIEKTAQTYAQIAGIYASRRLDRSSVKAQLERFTLLLPQNARLVDVGCGPGYDAAELRRLGFQVVGLDFSKEMMQAGKAQGTSVPFVQADMRWLPLAAESMNGLWVCASLLHLPRTAVPPVIRNFSRILTRGGILHLAVKEGLGEEWTAAAYGQPTPRFFTYWQEAALDSLLTRNGFKLIDGWIDSQPAVNWLIRFARKVG